jgi:hypothetical protein
MDEKKAAKLPALSATVLLPDANDPEATILELDELWSCVLKKIHQAWICIALCRKTRQVVAYAIGDRKLDCILCGLSILQAAGAMILEKKRDPRHLGPGGAGARLPVHMAKHSMPMPVRRT